MPRVADSWSRILVTLAPAALALAALAGCGDDDTAPAFDAAGATGDAATGIDGDTATADAATPTASYRAVALIGALDRVVVIKADAAADLCVVLRLVSPGFAGGLTIDTPDNWGVEYAFANPGAGACELFPPDGAATATGGSGEVSFTVDAGSFYPTSLSVEATVSFEPGEAWVPASAALSASDLPVEDTP